jgi:hypothetical protein
MAKIMRKLLIISVSIWVLAGWAGLARAQLFSSTGPVIAILDGELLVGEATGHLGGWGTIALGSNSKPGFTCTGEFSTADALGDSGRLRCGDGASLTFHFQRLSMLRGYGVGDAGRSLSFTYGLTAAESVRYLQLPLGKELRGEGGSLELAAKLPLARAEAPRN